jgi:hypothetical protein
MTAGVPADENSQEQTALSSVVAVAEV